MNRSVLVIIVVVLLLAIAGVGLALFWKPGLLNSNTVANTNSATNTTTGNLNTSTNTDIDNPALFTNFSADVSDSATVDKRISYREADIPVDRVEVTNGFTGGDAAPEGKKYVIIYFEKETFKQWPPVGNWLAQEVQLLSTKNTTYSYFTGAFYSQDEIEAGKQSYLTFEVDENDTGFTLRFVRDGEDVSVDLGV